MTIIQQARERLAAELAIAEDMKASAIVRTDDLRRLLDGPTEEEVARAINGFRLLHSPDGFRLYRDDVRIEGPWGDRDVELAEEALRTVQARAVLALFGRKS